MKDPLKTTEPNLTQTMILDVSKVNSPIELKVDQVTDWWALTLTLTITLIVSIISAYVTIKLVTKSNNNLIKNQNDQNDQNLRVQRDLQQLTIESQERQKRNELKNEYIRNWIDELKKPAENIIYYAETYMPSLSAVINAELECYRNIDLIDAYKEKSREFVEHFQKIHTNQISIQLHLNSNSQEEQEILNEISSIIQLCSKIHNDVIQKTRDLDPNIKANFKDFESKDDTQELYRKIKKLKESFRIILSKEWDKLKTFHDN
ncbi:hypothetical protein R4609_00710 [Acinetobacter baumannii]|nr:hypothetical protein [Acinetobacter baumannii]